MKAVEEFRIFTILCVLAINAFVCCKYEIYVKFMVNMLSSDYTDDYT